MTTPASAASATAALMVALNPPPRLRLATHFLDCTGCPANASSQSRTTWLIPLITPDQEPEPSLPRTRMAQRMLQVATP